jgi:hypothetical protein
VKQAFIILSIFFVALFAFQEFTGEFSPDALLIAEGKGEEATSLPATVFRYYRRGNQTFVFLSEDQKWVLKLFKGKFLNRSLLSKCLPPMTCFESLRYFSGEQKDKRMERTFAAYRLAWEKNRTNCALCSVHLEKTEHLNTNCTLIDAWGKRYAIDLNDYVFVVQLKMETTQARWLRLLHKKNLFQIKEDIKELFSLYKSEADAGIFDRDRNLMINTGFYQGRAVRLDVGKIREKQYDVTKELERIAWKKIEPWFRDHAPEHHLEMKLFLQKMIHSL